MKCVYPRLAAAATFPSLLFSLPPLSSPVQSNPVHWNDPVSQTRSPIKPCSFSWSSSSLHCYFPSCRKRYNFLITDWGAIPRKRTIFITLITMSKASAYTSIHNSHLL
ncbi:hypothetical protein M747DRAFT_295955 [Aspergillus niger ATCC 13496]|uniref:Secreted protein n=1 Tax=Aspergillus niger ATCC 13496 TaxID=1353008 RepID=A0A370BWQ9_ASPNG|nr:hypothetical protein M747DRAFT_295955 [Aspergillus niger ATCC 13496]